MQALMLAAGMGRRMGKYTEKITKCMINVGGRTLLDRTVESLREAGIQKLVMVVGWESEKLIDYVQQYIRGIEVEFVCNEDYAQTNNIYSLYLAREQLARDDTILLESDLVYDTTLIQKVVNCPDENLVVVAKYEHWMDGMVTTINVNGMIDEFIEKKNFTFHDVSNYYKTVNIYKLSRQFLCGQYIPFLEAYIKAYGKNQYYEMVLKAIAHLANAQLKAYVLEDIRWYEIDNAQDLDIANTLFSPEHEKLVCYERHFGGYWRFPGLKDFCYLVNPYFPPPKMVEQMQYFYTALLTQYPSGMSVQKLAAGRMFSVDGDYLLVGNGAAELIETLGRQLSGRLAVPIPAFNEYIRCFRQCEVVPIPSANYDFQLNVPALIKAAETSDILVVVNPDNPSGSFLNSRELITVLDACKTHHTLCIVDESFADFADRGQRYTLMKDEMLEAYPNLILIKSISKSYGVPGLRLGVLASSNCQLIETLRAGLPIWNINSFAEYFLQIFPLYQSYYGAACDQIARQRGLMARALEKISFLQPYPSQANYIMCAITGGCGAKELATRLLSEHNILIKDLTEKIGFLDKPFIRIAVKDEQENQELVSVLRSMDKSGRI